MVHMSLIHTLSRGSKQATQRCASVVHEPFDLKATKTLQAQVKLLLPLKYVEKFELGVLPTIRMIRDNPFKKSI